MRGAAGYPTGIRPPRLRSHLEVTGPIKLILIWRPFFRSLSTKADMEWADQTVLQLFLSRYFRRLPSHLVASKSGKRELTLRYCGEITVTKGAARDRPGSRLCGSQNGAAAR